LPVLFGGSQSKLTNRMKGFTKGCENVAFKLSYFVNVGEFVVVRANMPVLPLRVGNMLACQL